MIFMIRADTASRHESNILFLSSSLAGSLPRGAAQAFTKTGILHRSKPCLTLLETNLHMCSSQADITRFNMDIYYIFSFQYPNRVFVSFVTKKVRVSVPRNKLGPTSLKVCFKSSIADVTAVSTSSEPHFACLRE